MSQMIKRSAQVAPLLISLLVGCLSPWPALGGEALSAVNIVIEDQRTNLQRSSRVESDANGTNEFLGDDKLRPAGPEMLRDFLNKKIGPDVSGKSMQLTDFSVSIYAPAVSLPYEGGPYGDPDPLTKLLSLGVEKLKSERTVLVQISGNFSGKSFAGTASETFKGFVSDGNIKSTIIAAMEDVWSQIYQLGNRVP